MTKKACPLEQAFIKNEARTYNIKRTLQHYFPHCLNGNPMLSHKVTIPPPYLTGGGQGEGLFLSVDNLTCLLISILLDE